MGTSIKYGKTQQYMQKVQLNKSDHLIMKKTLFGGMKVKGPSAKQQQPKKSQPIPASQTTLPAQPKQSHTQPDPIHQNPSTKSLSNQQNLSGIETQLKKQKTSLQSVLKQDQPKLNRNQSNKQQPSRPFSGIQKQLTDQAGIQKQSSKSTYQKKDRRSKQEQQTIVRKDFTKSRSEKNYDGYDSEDNQDIREDRSVVVGRKQEQKEELQYKKNHKPKPTSTGPKSNPLLSQIKKITRNKDKSEPFKQSLSKSKTINQAGQSQKPKRQKSAVMQELYLSHNRILQSIMRKKQAKQQIITLTSHVMQLKQELSVMVNKQNHYIASEEYELADKLENNISQITSKVTEEQVEINFLQQQLFKLELQGIAILRTHFDEEKRTIRRLKLVELDIEDQISHYKRQEEENIENSKTLNQNEKKKYQRIVTDIKNQSEQLHKYEKTFYEDLNGRKSPLQSQLSDEQHKKTELQTQIKQLQQKLKKKKTFLKATLTNIDCTKQKLHEVDKTFKQEKQKLDERKKHIQQLESQKTQQHQRLQELQDKVKALQKEKSQQIAKKTKQKESYHKLSTQIEQFFQSIDVQEFLNRKKLIVEQFMNDSQLLKAFEEKHKQKKDKVKELEFKKSNTLSQITKNEQRIKQLKSRIPKLQNEQKQLSLAKNFKGAGMKKNEIKQCTDQIIEVKKVIEEAYAAEAQIDASIEEINSEHEKYIEEENELRKNLAISQYHLALQKKTQLIRQLEWVKELQKNSKTRTLYEPKLNEELEQLQEQITYIAQEYELEPENEQQIPQVDSIKVSSKPSSSNIVQSLSPLNTSESSYVPLTVNGNEQHEQQQEQQKQESRGYSNQALQEEERQNMEEDRSEQQRQPQDEPLDQQEHNHSAQRAYEPLELVQNENQQQKEEEPVQENKLEQEQEEDKENNQKLSSRHEEEQSGQNDPSGGYVPLQLD